MNRWSPNRMKQEKRIQANEEKRLRDMEYELAQRAREFKAYKERFADQWIRVHEGRKAIDEQEAMIDG